jgi:WD40 repeat protein
MRTRSQSTARTTLRADAKEPRRSKSKSRKRTDSRSRSRSSSPNKSRSNKRQRSKSKSVARPKTSSSSSTTTRRPTSPTGEQSSSSSSRPTTTVDQELQRDIDRDEKKLKKAKRELKELEDELAELQKRVDAKKYEVLDLQIVVDGLHKRRQLQQQFLRRDSFTGGSAVSVPVAASRRDPSPEPQLSSRGAKQKSKRPVIDEEDEEDTDDEIEIIDTPPPPPVRVKEEEKRGRSRTRSTTAASSTRSSSSKPKSDTKDLAKPVVTAPTPPQPTPAAVDQMSDYFWGRVDIAKLLVQPRMHNIPDASARKGRHLAFNPVQHNVFAVSSDDGGLLVWNYARQTQELTKVVSIAPASFRKESQCAESMAWSPDGYRLALAFRDPIAGMGEFCIVRLHELPYVTPIPQVLPRERVKSKSTTLHSKGISVIEWIPGGYGDRTGARGVVTAGPDHAVVLWEENKGQADYKWRVLHREHRSDVRTICMHSQGNALYTGALDGTVIRYDLHSQKTVTIVERRRPHISKINAVLENPHNPNLLLVSSVEPSEHNLVLHDLREKYDHARQKAMTLSYQRASDAKSMSQYIVPRWSPGGFHVSCGSTSGLVNIWDVRVRGPQYPTVLPQQSIQVHRTFVSIRLLSFLHAAER